MSDFEAAAPGREAWLLHMRREGEREADALDPDRDDYWEGIGPTHLSFVERFLSDDDFDRWVAAADWLVLPYRRSWSSGVLARAQALGTPAIVAAAGGLPEQAGDGDMVFDDDEGLRAALVRAAASGAVGGGRP